MRFNNRYSGDKDSSGYINNIETHILPNIYLLHSRIEDTSKYVHLMQHQGVLKGKIDEMYQNPGNYASDVVKGLAQNVELLYKNVEIYNKNDATDKEHQKSTIKDFFSKYQEEFSIAFKHSPEAIFQILSSCKIIYLQMLFFSKFKKVVKDFLGSIGRNQAVILLKKYFYSTPVSLKNYSNSNDMLSRADFDMGRYNAQKINVELIDALLDKKTRDLAF